MCFTYSSPRIVVFYVLKPANKRVESKAGEDGQVALAEPTPADLAHGFAPAGASLDHM